MSNYQSPESKKQEFRKYLEKSGVIDALTKVLVGLYEEPDRPQNAIDYIKRYLGAPVGIDVEALKAENERLKREKSELENQIKELSTQKTDSK
mmetsp:Transcript_16182/g.14624  ORF Transcript_16182/g.14624 Transcript_16182/m.14624 type:complete len:93 (+) Transcript_16182:34-312(+)